MDETKCNALKRELAGEPEPQVVPIERFLDGNDDVASIGGNLPKHPGLEVFRDVLAGLRRQPGVEGVYAQIFELDPGEEYWPCCDTVLVVGSLPANTLRTAVRPLRPDEVRTLDPDDVPGPVSERHGTSPVLAIFWE